MERRGNTHMRRPTRRTCRPFTDARCDSTCRSWHDWSIAGTLREMIFGVSGAVVGRTTRIEHHPGGHLIWLAYVDIGDGEPARQIVFGGDSKLETNDLVPVAPPRSRITVVYPELCATREKKMRTRSYRGQKSHGMLCSLEELGWLYGGPNEVAVLRRLPVGFRLDDLHWDDRPSVVAGWHRAWRIAQGVTPAEADGPRTDDHRGETAAALLGGR